LQKADVIAVSVLPKRFEMGAKYLPRPYVRRWDNPPVATLPWAIEISRWCLIPSMVKKPKI
jgi:hypothetical protein